MVGYASFCLSGKHGCFLFSSRVRTYACNWVWIMWKHSCDRDGFVVLLTPVLLGLKVCVDTLAFILAFLIVAFMRQNEGTQPLELRSNNVQPISVCYTYLYLALPVLYLVGAAHVLFRSWLNV